MSNPKPARWRDEFEIWWAGRTVQSIVTGAAKKDLCWLAYKAALSAAARCNRCAADLCEHDNCTDWTCARACGKCAPGPAPARDGVRCKLCAEGMPLKKYLDGTMRHFDGLMAWHQCKAQGRIIKLLARLNADQFVTVNVGELRELLANCAAKEQADGQG